MPVMCGSTTQRVAAMPSQAITGERPGSAKSRLMAVPERWERSGGMAALDREVAMGGAQRHRESAQNVDEADDEQQEEGRGAGLPDQDELDEHGEEKDQRQRVIDHAAHA